MPDFGRNSRGDDPSLDAVVRSDQFIDALAAGSTVAPQDRADAMLASMLGEWRDEMRWPPATGLITERDAVAALRSGLAEKQKHTPVRSRRGLSIVGAAAAVVLAIGGIVAVDFGAPKEVRNDQVALAAQAQLNQVQELITRGDWEQAEDKLVEVSSQVQSVVDEQQKQQLFDQWNQLSAKVVEKDPEATVPPNTTFQPSGTELVPTPAPTTVPTTPVPPITPEPMSSQEPSSPSSSQSEGTSPSSSVSTSPAEGTSPSTSPAPTTTPSTTAPPATTTPTSTTTTTTIDTTTTPSSAATTQPAAPSQAPTTTTGVIQQSVASEPSSATAPTSTPGAPVTTTIVAPTTVVQQPTTVVQQTIAPTRQQAPVIITTTVVPQIGVAPGGGN